MAALSVSTVPSSRISVGIWPSGLAWASCACAESASQVEARTMLYGTPQWRRAHSMAAEPEPLEPKRVSMGSDPAVMSRRR